MSILATTVPTPSRVNEVSLESMRNTKSMVAVVNMRSIVSMAVVDSLKRESVVSGPQCLSIVALSNQESVVSGLAVVRGQAVETPLLRKPLREALRWGGVRGLVARQDG